MSRASLDGLDLVGLAGLKRVVAQGQENVNETAAMPSMHTAYATLLALHVIDYQQHSLRRFVVAYPVAMGVVLVATGEHYVVDVLAGAALAGVAYYAVAPRRDTATND